MWRIFIFLRKVISSDTPGHVEYTRNMVRLHFKVSIILIDARKELLKPTVTFLSIIY
jgi:sulfate adenylyltransferase subunit 1 (EFTu-like GTPase family)